MKTAVTVLQEMMMKIGQTPEYECVAQSGPQHLATFEYRCRALGSAVQAIARSKKEAKQEAARLMLLKLAACGESVPPPYNIPPPSRDSAGTQKGESSSSGPAPHSYVALLKDLCEEYRLPGVEYELVGDTGPPHMRQFTMRARLGQHERLATASTKKTARQVAAEQLYKYMRENLARLTKDFDEEQALARAHERAMERYIEVREDVWRPDLGQRPADYHLALKAHTDPDKCEKARLILAELDIDTADEKTLEVFLEAAASELGVKVVASSLAGSPAPLHVVELSPSCPALAFAGTHRAAPAAAALRYIRLVLA